MKRSKHLRVRLRGQQLIQEMSTAKQQGGVEAVFKLAQSLSWGDVEAIIAEMEYKNLQSGLVLLEGLANANLKSDDFSVLQLSLSYPLATKIPPSILFRLAEQARSAWTATDLEPIVDSWNAIHPLADDKYWVVFPRFGVFFPFEENVPGLMARALTEYRAKLQICSNPECGRRYVAKRRDQKYCLADECLKYGNRIAVKKFANKGKSDTRTHRGGRRHGTRKTR